MKKILIVFGTRPEAIKMAPVIKAFQGFPDLYQVRVCVTGQHREMLDQVLHFFEIVPDYDLELMRAGQQLGDLTAAILLGIQPVLQSFQPAYLFVHGDTTTSTFSALAAYYAGIKVCHVEAGLRTYNINSPFPEEANRQITARLAVIHFAPTTSAKANLLKEGIDENTVFVTGNTVIDALAMASQKVVQMKHEAIEQLKMLISKDRPVILVTCHRRENFGRGFKEICRALKTIAENQDVQIIYPVHLNPEIRNYAFVELGKVSGIHLIAPLDYPSFIWLMNRSHFIITDSGGIQEEGTALGKSILLMRDYTERPEAVIAGSVKLVGSDYKMIVEEAVKLLQQGINILSTDHKIINPYGNGAASKLIVELMKQADV